MCYSPGLQVYKFHKTPHCASITSICSLVCKYLELSDIVVAAVFDVIIITFFLTKHRSSLIYHNSTIAYYISLPRLLLTANMIVLKLSMPHTKAYSKWDSQ